MILQHLDLDKVHKNEIHSYIVLLNIVLLVIPCLQSTDIPDNEFILHDHLENINRLFDGETVEQIFTNLEKDGSEWAISQLNTLKKMVRLLRYLTLKMPRKPTSENVICLCCLLNILANFSNLFLHTGKQCGP